MSLIISSFAGHTFQSVHLVDAESLDSDLLCAKFADRCRDAKTQPVAPADFHGQFFNLDSESKCRFSLVVDGLGDEIAHRALFENRDNGSVQELMSKFVSEHNLLTVEILNESGLRREEFVRHFAAKVGLGIEGESKKESRKRLERIDFRLLMEEAERARESAEGRMEYLRQLQEKQEEEFAPRGKI